MLKIRRPLGRLIFNMGIAIPGKTVFLIETAPCISYVKIYQLKVLRALKRFGKAPRPCKPSMRTVDYSFVNITNQVTYICIVFSVRQHGLQHQALNAAYNECIKSLSHFRTQHIRIVTRWGGYSNSVIHDDVTKYFPRYWPFVRGSHRWIPLTKASDAELWCFL